MAEVNFKNVQSKRSNQENEEDDSHGSEIEQKVIQRDFSPKGANLARIEIQGNDVAHPLLLNLVLHLDEEKREVKIKVKRREDLLVCLRLHHLLIPRALRVRQTTKKPRSSILYLIKINLNETSRLRLHLMKTHKLRNISQKKVSRRNL